MAAGAEELLATVVTLYGSGIPGTLIEQEYLLSLCYRLPDGTDHNV